MVPKLPILIALGFLFVSIRLCAQHISWDKINNEKFTQDSIHSFRNDQVQNRIIYPINESTADLEIRIYSNSSNSTNSGEISIVKFFADTVMAELR